VSTSSTARNFGAIETAAAFSKSVGRLVRISTARDAMFLDINDGDSSDNACDSFFAPAESNCRSHFFRELPAHWCSTAASVVASSLTFPSSEVVLVEEAEVYQAEAFLLFYKVSGSQVCSPPRSPPRAASPPCHVALVCFSDFLRPHPPLSGRA